MSIWKKLGQHPFFLNGGIALMMALIGAVSVFAASGHQVRQLVLIRLNVDRFIGANQSEEPERERKISCINVDPDNCIKQT